MNIFSLKSGTVSIGKHCSQVAFWAAICNKEEQEVRKTICGLRTQAEAEITKTPEPDEPCFVNVGYKAVPLEGFKLLKVLMPLYP